MKAWTPLLLTLFGASTLGSLAIYRLTQISPWPLAIATGAGFVAYAAWMLWESRVSVRELTKPEPYADRGTMEFCAFVKLTLLFAALIGGTWHLPFAVAFTLSLCGLALLASGIALRTAAIRTLGASYSHRIRTPQPVITTGPYAFIRHPAYVGTLLIHTGIVCLRANWYSLATLVVWFGAVWLRTRIEEAYLLSTAASYPDYRRSVRGSWLPRPSATSFQRRLPSLLSATFIITISLLSAWKLAAVPHSLRLGLGFLILCYLAWLVVESRFALREVSQDHTAIDRGTLELYAFGRAATVLSALALPIAWNGLGLWYPAAFAIFLTGVGLRLLAIQALGPFYSHRVRITDSHQIVNRGPYRWMRHPAYTGMIVAHCGFVFCFFNWISVSILLLVLVPAVIVRIRVEERAMTALAGYAEYARSRARLIPRLW